MECKCCKKKIEAKLTGRPKKFCSSKCRLKYWRDETKLIQSETKLILDETKLPESETKLQNDETKLPLHETKRETKLPSSETKLKNKVTLDLVAELQGYTSYKEMVRRLGSQSALKIVKDCGVDIKKLE